MPLYAGLMSGTSLDGMDTVFVDIQVLDADPARPRFALALRGSAFAVYPEDLRVRLRRIRAGTPVPIAEITALHYALGAAYADAVVQAAAEFGIVTTEIAALGLHGQTVWHAPPSSGAPVPGTLQLGQPAVLAERLGCPVVSDFRAADLAAGGEGAPLVPFADYALLRSPTETRAALNLGGIANLTFLPAGGTLAETRAFDTGPGNLVLDGLALALTGRPHDRDGALAASGRADPALLAELLAHPYFLAPPPKSTGAELFSPAYVTALIRRAAHLSPADMLATAAQLTAQSIARALHGFLPRLPDRIIAGGGGTRNRAVLDGLRRALPGVTLDTHDAFPTHAGIIPAGAKEGLAFALLAAARMHQIPANVPAATGARGPRLLGMVTMPERTL